MKCIISIFTLFQIGCRFYFTKQPFDRAIAKISDRITPHFSKSIIPNNLLWTSFLFIRTLINLFCWGSSSEGSKEFFAGVLIYVSRQKQFCFMARYQFDVEKQRPVFAMTEIYYTSIWDRDFVIWFITWFCENL